MQSVFYLLLCRRKEKGGKQNMKKYAVIEYIGKWEKMPNGKMRIYCTVEEKRLVADSDDRDELIAKYGLFGTPMDCREDGKWYSLMGVCERKWARKMLK